MIGVTQGCTVNVGSNTFPIINLHQWDHYMIQEVIVTAISGANVTISDPLALDLTNNPCVIIVGNNSTSGVGIENLTITGSNSITHALSSAANMIWFQSCQDCWMTNCNINWGNGYMVYCVDCAHMTIDGNWIAHGQAVGPNHSGMALYSIGGSIIENNIISDGLYPALEVDIGCSGNAFFANFFTNNWFDVMYHEPHPFMDLWEENYMSSYFIIDGYFGSFSHHTLFRNAVACWASPLVQGQNPGYIPIMFDRFVSHCSVVGNVLGNPVNTYTGFTTTNNGGGAVIALFGFPNGGNQGYSGSSPPLAWNFPGTTFSEQLCGKVWTNGIGHITSTQVGVTTITGSSFTNIPWASGYYTSPYSLVFQDGVNTNIYYPTNGVAVAAASAGTATSLTLTAPINVTNGWTVFMSGQDAYQQIQLTAQSTHLWTGNYDYYNKAVQWNSNGVQTIPVSLLYTNAAPGWWGTNRWPAIDPNAAVMVTTLPAQARYGITGNPGNPEARPVTGPDWTAHCFGDSFRRLFQWPQWYARFSHPSALELSAIIGAELSAASSSRQKTCTSRHWAG